MLLLDIELYFKIGDCCLNSKLTWESIFWTLIAFKLEEYLKGFPVRLFEVDFSRISFLYQNFMIVNLIHSFITFIAFSHLCL